MSFNYDVNNYPYYSPVNLYPFVFIFSPDRGLLTLLKADEIFDFLMEDGCTPEEAAFYFLTEDGRPCKVDRGF